MPRTRPKLYQLVPSELQLGDDHVDFIERLPGPAFINVKGRSGSRRRMIVTLLHGNEPSGLKAVHRLLMDKVRPAFDMGVIIAAVDAAKANPPFSHRYLPGERDLNRCFRPPFTTDQEKLAGLILEAIDNFSPEFVIDTHNTSSHSRPFCVASHENETIHRIASQFSDRLVVLGQPLGTLMERSSEQRPIVTTEFGGFMDPNADRLAFETLLGVWMGEPAANEPPVCLKHPFRLETVHDLEVSYSSSLVESADLTMLNTIDQLNFQNVAPGTTLGWYRSHVHKSLVALNHTGDNRFPDYFAESHDTLITRSPMTLFMATTDPLVANTDCMFYFTPLDTPLE